MRGKMAKLWISKTLTAYIIFLTIIIVGPLLLNYYIRKDLIENSNRPQRSLSPYEAAGNNIMLTIRTTRPYHQTRLPLLFDTWLNTVNTSNVFIVTDGKDPEYEEKCKKLGMHYEILSCGLTHTRKSLCCKTGEEISLAYREENKHYDWFCHVDDDSYLIAKNLIKHLSKFDPKKEPVYLGRKRGPMFMPKLKIPSKQTLIKGNKLRASYAVGTFYCFSRPMLDKVKPWLGNGEALADTCDKLLCPDDWTLGVVVELLANEKLTDTWLFHYHNVVLSRNVNPYTLADQIGFNYGCGELCYKNKLKHNAIFVPKAMFSYKEDPSRFLSLHCQLHPKAKICKKNKN